HRLECIAHLIASMFLFTIPPPPPSTLFPYTTLFRSTRVLAFDYLHRVSLQASHPVVLGNAVRNFNAAGQVEQRILSKGNRDLAGDRKSTRLNSSHQIISYAVFCLKKKKTNKQISELK